jgi:hypothetical protein
MAKLYHNAMLATPVCISMFLVGICSATGQTNCLGSGVRTNYLSRHAWPKLTIKSVVAPKEKTQPLQLTFELASVGKTPVAVAENQFTVVIAKWRWFFEGKLSLTNTTSKILTVHPDKPLTVSALVFLTEAEAEKKHWIDLAPGKYRAQIYVNSGKTQQFDYQYMGQNFSDQYEFEVK